jgi:LacI family transcriptional regulator
MTYYAFGGFRLSSTLKEIAKELGLTASTVSRVVNSKEYVKPETRKLVLKALEKYNYMPNQTARNLRSKKTNMIAVIVPDISEGFISNIVKVLEHVLGESGYSIILCDTNEEPEKEEQYLNILLQKQIDGVIIATVSKKPDAIFKYFDKNLGVVFFDNLPNINVSFDAVITDNVKSSNMAVNYLCDLGHKKIGIIAAKQDETTGFERLIGYKKALTDHEIEISDNLIAIGDFKEQSGYDCMKTLMNRNPDMTAVYAVSSKMTFGAIKAAQENGKKIPDDISIVGFDVHDPSGLICPCITTIIQDEVNIAKLVSENIIKGIADKENSVKKKILLEANLVIGNSCRAI